MVIVYLPPLLRLPPLGPGEGAQAHGVLAFMEGGALLESVANQRIARYYFFFILVCLLSTLITLFIIILTSNDAVEN